MPVNDYNALPDTFVSPDPAVGQEATYTATDDISIESIRFTLVTSAAVANRFPALKLVDSSGNEVWRCSDSGARVASGTYEYSFFPGAPGSGLGVGFPLPIEGLKMRKGDVLSTVTTGKDAADDYSAAKLRVGKW